MDLNLIFFACAIPAVLFAGISKGGFGAGGAFAAAPILALILDPAQAVGLMLPLLMVMDATALRSFWRRWNWPLARLMMIGSVPGVICGAVFYQVANADVLRILIGLIALGFVGYQLARSRGYLRFERQQRAGPMGGLFWGGVSGFTSFISHAGGPPAAVFLLTRGLDKTTYQATTVLVFASINAYKAVLYTGLGIFSSEMLLGALFLVPVAFAGVRLGVWLHRWMPERHFFALTYVLLTLAGTKLIFDALF